MENSSKFDSLFFKHHCVFITCALSFLLLIVVGCSEVETIPIGTDTDSEDTSIVNNNDNTLMNYLKNNESYKDFYKIVNMSSAKGDINPDSLYTCLIPNDIAIDAYLRRKGLTSINQLDINTCDTIVRTHFIRGRIYLDSTKCGYFPNVNLQDQIFYLIRNDGSNNGHFLSEYYINYQYKLIQRNDTLKNGVAHVINQVIEPNRLLLGDLLMEDSTISIFTNTMRLTGLDVCLNEFKTCNNSNFPSVYGFYEIKDNHNCFTMLAVKNSIYRSMGIFNTSDLINKLMNNELGISNSNISSVFDYRDTNNVVYKYIAYHILDRNSPFNNVENNFVYNINNREPCFLYETMCTHKRIKVQKSVDGNFYLYGLNYDNSDQNILNGQQGLGIRILKPYEMLGVKKQALNGEFYYVENAILF